MRNPHGKRNNIIGGSEKTIQRILASKRGAIVRKRPGMGGKRRSILENGGRIGPLMHEREIYLDRVLGPKLVGRKNESRILPKEFGAISLGMALRRAFASIGLPEKIKRIRVGLVVEDLYAKGRISFGKETKIVFVKPAADEIKKRLGKNGPVFMDNLRKYLQDETNFVKDYIHRKTKNALSESEKWGPDGIYS